jgi:uncharacterized membrane protein YkgB
VLVHQLGKMLVILGLVVVVAGLLLMTGLKIPGFGKLPGDIVYRSRNTTLYFPIVTCLILSAALTLFLWLARILIRR